ncbi:MAG TPA: alkaline phosphatase family protein [Longimicrobiaceae bacterium]|nr:alkaline phosphatase family protein [Longimicrobiaceae bacterium]
MADLIIFVDSLRYDSPLAERLVGTGLVRRRYIPPLGYSANILPLLYRGCTPDELGFYNEYGVSDHDRHLWTRRLDGAVRALSRVPVLRKVAYRGFGFVGIDAANIPPRLLPYFAKHSTSAYALGEENASVFDRHSVAVLLGSRMRAAPPRRDVVALRRAEAAVDTNHRLYVSLSDLDSVSHEWGLESSEYERHEDLLYEGIQRLVTRFRSRHGEGGAVVIHSDHGMAPVERTIDLDLEARLGPAGRATYLYFLDSTMLRVWFHEPALESELRVLLGELGDAGTFVTDAERRQWGLSSRRSGDLIYVLREGLIFEPNFIGRGVPAAMHGYHPRHESQHAVLLTDAPEHLPPDPLEGAALHETLQRILGRD